MEAPGSSPLPGRIDPQILPLPAARQFPIFGVHPSGGAGQLIRVERHVAQAN